jgi:hypothetical protein
MRPECFKKLLIINIVDAAHEALGLLEGDEFDNTIDEED